MLWWFLKIKSVFPLPVKVYIYIYSNRKKPFLDIYGKNSLCLNKSCTIVVNFPKTTEKKHNESIINDSEKLLLNLTVVLKLIMFILLLYMLPISITAFNLTKFILYISQ